MIIDNIRDIEDGLLELKEDNEKLYKRHKLIYNIINFILRITNFILCGIVVKFGYNQFITSATSLQPINLPQALMLDVLVSFIVNIYFDDGIFMKGSPSFVYIMFKSMYTLLQTISFMFIMYIVSLFM